MPASMDYPSPKRLRSESEAESADEIMVENFQFNILADEAKVELFSWLGQWGPHYSNSLVVCDMKLSFSDRISCLPEDVIGFILSFLTSREARATCLLSRRWRHLCTCRVTNLDFDWYDLLAGLKDNPELLEKERARYAEWVDNVLHPQSGAYHLHRFALRFDLNISYQSHIDRWIRFALAKRVKVLQLCFEPASFKDFWPDPDGDPSRLPYILGKETLMDVDVGCSQQTSSLSNFGLSPSSSWHVGFRYLEELSLTRVTMKGEFIEQLLANCPVLERLILVLVASLNVLRVSGQSLKLKYLRIHSCDDLECVEIYDTNLVSFSMCGEEIPLCLDKLPHLSEVSIILSPLGLVHVTFSRLSSLSCLQILKLEFFSPHENLRIRQLPKLTSVRQLELRLVDCGDASLLPLTLLVEACPYLRSLVFELKDHLEKLCRQRELIRVVRPPHRYLKAIEFYNYRGRPCDHELVNYLVENAIALEKLVVNPCDEEYFFSDGMESVKEPRERALQQLKENLPSRIELMIS